MSTNETEAFLEAQSQHRGYTLEMHRIMAEVDLEWAKKYGDFIEATYTGQRTLDRKTQGAVADSGGGGPESRRGADSSSRAGSFAVGRNPHGNPGSPAIGNRPDGRPGLSQRTTGLGAGDGVLA